MSGFTHWECPDCQWDCVLREGRETVVICPLCLSDSRHVRRCRPRPATDDDKPEGDDEREAA